MKKILLLYYIMNISTILLIIVIIVLLYIVVRYIASDVNTLTGLSSGTAMTTIPSTSLAKSSSGNISSNFAYSVWFYVNDWNYRYGEPKVIFARASSSPPNSSSLNSSSGGCAGTQYGCCSYPDDATPKINNDGTNCASFCPGVILGAITNNLDISLKVYPGVDSLSDMSGNHNSFPYNCSVQNVPIQKWVNLLISVYGRTLDVYLDGKLVKTCVLPGFAQINPDANVYVTPNGGFSGWTAKFQYYPNSIDPQTAWNIYQQGYGSTMLSNIFGKYQVKVSLVENGADASSLTI